MLQTKDQRIQLEDESFDDFLTKVQLKCQNCEFADADRLLIFKILVGIRNNHLQSDLVSDPDPTLESVIRMCRESEKRSFVDGNVIELQHINEDCLKQILQNLNFMDGVNLSKTCKRLMNIVNSEFIPRKTKQIQIDINAKTIVLTAPSVKVYKSGLTLGGLETEFDYLQEFVEDLTFKLRYRASSNENDVIWRYSVDIIKHCQHLKALRFESWFFTSDQINELQDQIRRLPNLKELHIVQCSGITKNWRADSRHTSKIEKLTLLNGDDESDGNFIDYFRNLSSLTIEFNVNSTWRTEDIAKMFDYNAHSLKHLKLSKLPFLEGYDSVGRLITEKLRKLERLELGFPLTESSAYMTELPHLKSLRISCDERHINALLRTLSDNGIIEELTIIFTGFMHDFENGANARLPLTFSKLHSFRLQYIRSPSLLLKIMTAAQTPEIHTLIIQCSYIMNVQIPEEDLLKFIEAKKTLKFIRVASLNPNQSVRIAFICDVIDLLKKPCKPHRPLLTIEVRPISLEPTEMEFLNENGHLIKVNFVDIKDFCGLVPANWFDSFRFRYR